MILRWYSSLFLAQILNFIQYPWSRRFEWRVSHTFEIKLVENHLKSKLRNQNCWPKLCAAFTFCLCFLFISLDFRLNFCTQQQQWTCNERARARFLTIFCRDRKSEMFCIIWFCDFVFVWNRQHRWANILLLCHRRQLSWAVDCWARLSSWFYSSVKAGSGWFTWFSKK